MQYYLTTSGAHAARGLFDPPVTRTLALRGRQIDVRGCNLQRHRVRRACGQGRADRSACHSQPGKGECQGFRKFFHRVILHQRGVGGIGRGLDPKVPTLLLKPVIRPVRRTCRRASIKPRPRSDQRLGCLTNSVRQRTDGGFQSTGASPYCSNGMVDDHDLCAGYRQFRAQSRGVR